MRTRQKYYARASYAFKLVAVFLAYFLTAKAGLSLEPVSGFATLVWPPAGIALAALLLYGNKLWPAIALGAFLANFSQGAPWYTAVGIALGNTLEALAGRYFLRNIAHFRNSFSNLSDVFVFVVYAAVFSTLISATLGTVTLRLSGLVQMENFSSTWLAWWVGDMLGCLIAGPFLLLWLRGFSVKLSFRRLVETGIWFAILILTSLIVFAGLLGINIPPKPINFIIYLPLIVITLRFGPREYTLAMIILSATAIWGISQGYSIYAGNDLVTSLFLLGIFFGSTAVTFLSLSILMQEKRDFEARKDEFLAIASHELKTPTTTIKAYVDLLKRRIPKQKKEFGLYVLRMDEQVQRLIKLVNDMLDINRISSGKMELGPETFLIADFVKKNLRDLQKTSKKHKLLYQGKTEARVTADKYKINQVLTNLISNSLKFSPDRSDITVKILSSGKFVKISIKDRGIGISKQHQSEIFKRFFQVSGEHRNGKVGLGLGLYISGEIIKKHGGKMWVKSTEGKGSTFYFTLPKAKTS